MPEQKRIVLQMSENKPVVAWALGKDFSQEEHEYTRAEKEKSFALFPNIGSITALMMSCEGFPFPPITSSPGVSITAPEGDGQISVLRDVDSLDSLITAFGDKPTASKRNEAKRAATLWHLDYELCLYLPLRDCIAASRDLRNLLTVLLFSTGDCSHENLRKTLETGFVFASEERHGCEYYGRHVQKLDNDLHVLSTLASNFLSSCDCNSASIREECWDFSSFVINVFLGDVHPKITERGFEKAGEDDSLGSVYAFWVEKALAGKAAVCDRCGKLFTRQRNTRKYCSDSCKVAASLARKASKA